MSILGVGPSIAIGGFSSILIIVILDEFLGVAFRFSPPTDSVLFVIGLPLFAIGAILWFSSARMVITGFNAKKLVTSGPFRVTRNPLYSAFIVFIAPGIACVTNNFLYLICTIVMYIIFKSRIWKEEEYLAKEFGEEYAKYEKKVAQLVPFVKI